MYINWNRCTSLSILSPSLRWYPVEELITYLHDLKSYILYNNSNSAAVKSYNCQLPTLRCFSHKLPATETRRFPLKTFYLCEGIGNWARQEMDVLFSIHTLLLSADQQVEPEIVIKDEGLDYSAVSIHQSMSEGHIEINTLMIINQILKSIEVNDRNNIITLKDFEARSKLIWIDDQMSHDVMKCDNIICHCFRLAILTFAYISHSVKKVKSGTNRL
ncbi:MAG: hypothetical protein EXX96DRAFT_579017 [Benjaminiella poitrasii]|nr:MAG: hypothetical protein EXX96DRAFT_579017 [Benjaminiella poitrasii]